MITSELEKALLEIPNIHSNIVKPNMESIHALIEHMFKRKREIFASRSADLRMGNIQWMKESIAKARELSLNDAEFIVAYTAVMVKGISLSIATRDL